MNKALCRGNKSSGTTPSFCKSASTISLSPVQVNKISSCIWLDWEAHRKKHYLQHNHSLKNVSYNSIHTNRFINSIIIDTLCHLFPNHYQSSTTIYHMTDAPCLGHVMTSEQTPSTKEDREMRFKAPEKSRKCKIVPRANEFDIWQSLNDVS